LHTVTVSIQGSVNVAESVEVDDAEALPLFIRLKAVLESAEAPKPLRRRGRSRRETGSADDASTVALPGDNGATDSSGEV